MAIVDWYDTPPTINIKRYSANGVPYPLDEYLKLCGKMTTFEAVELIKRWYRE
jgi:hypothetical protein